MSRQEYNSSEKKKQTNPKPHLKHFNQPMQFSVGKCINEIQLSSFNGILIQYKVSDKKNPLLMPRISG